MEIGNVGNKFKVAILAAKRAKQIMKNGKKKVEINAFNPLTVALEEIKQGLVTYETIIEDEKNSIIDLSESEVQETEEEVLKTEGIEAEVIEPEGASDESDENATEEEILKKNLDSE